LTVSPSCKVRFLFKPKVSAPTAVVGSPGLRSIGKLALNLLREQLQPKLWAELYSPSFPAVHQTRPSYASQPSLPGWAGGLLEGKALSLPRVKFFLTSAPTPLVVVEGYHANFQGQYEVAERVVELLGELGVKRMYVLAGYGLEGAEVACAATSLNLLEEAKKFGLEPGYEGPFMGFSGLVFGLGMLKGIEGLCLFGKTQPDPAEPENPDPQAAAAVVRKLDAILNLRLDSSRLMGEGKEGRN
jgi:hypothetical protein